MNFSNKLGRNMPAAVTAGIFLMILIFCSLSYSDLIFSLIVSIFAGIGGYEIISVLKKQRKIEYNSYFLGFLCFLYNFSAYFSDIYQHLILWVFFCIIGCTITSSYQCKKYIIGIITYVPLLLGISCLLIKESFGKNILAYLLILIISSDICGLFCGVAFGKHKILPKISPSKTWEGLIGAFIISSFISVVILINYYSFDWWWGILVSLCVVIIGTFGDFFESNIKRNLNIKDMSTIIPGHGGIMDRIDSIIFNLPIIYIIYLIIIK